MSFRVVCLSLLVSLSLVTVGYADKGARGENIILSCSGTVDIIYPKGEPFHANANTDLIVDLSRGVVEVAGEMSYPATIGEHIITANLNNPPSYIDEITINRDTGKFTHLREWPQSNQAIAWVMDCKRITGGIF